MPKAPSERQIVFLVGAVQFINILDFMMVMPLGPDFARSLGIKVSDLGAIGGSYTAAAGISGLLGALFLDRFDRRKALAISVLGLVLGTAAGGFAVDLWTLMAARVIAGAFGGPATSLALAIIADTIPAERRGKALGAVMGAFSVASVLGVPAGLEIAQRGGWRAPFFAVAALGVLVDVATFALLPPMRGHLEARANEPPAHFGDLFRRPVVLLSWVMTGCLMMASFSVVPNLSAYFQNNLGYPRDSLGTLYLVGGMLSFFAMRGVGWLVDRFGSFRVGSAGTLWFLGVLFVGFVEGGRGLPVMILFVAFMLSNSLRGVPHNTLTSKVPSPRERARFMSIQSAVQHFASAAGAFASAKLLHELPGGKLEGMATVAMFSMLLAATFPALSWAVESRLAAPKREPMPAPEHAA
jgi:predicted MFS family arabinose efflux permease